jgi:hypothetical protein
MCSSVRTVLGLVLTAVVAAGCSSGAASQPLSADPVATAGATAAPRPSPANTPRLITAPPPTPVASVEPMAPAHVTGIATFWSTDGTTTTVGDATHIRDVVVTSHEDTTDPRVTGTTTVNLSVDAIGDMGWESADATLRTASGSWTGTCRGVAWGQGNASLIECWFEGNGPYAGLTYFEQISTMGVTAKIEGVIAPLPGPAV